MIPMLFQGLKPRIPGTVKPDIPGIETTRSGVETTHSEG